MGSTSILQVIIIILLFALIFGDLPKIVSTIKKNIKSFINNQNRKKGN